jgi:arginine decarboxylase
MIDEIINQIKIACDEAEVDVPNILLNLVPLGEKVEVLYTIFCTKNNKMIEKWNMIDSSFILLTWAITTLYMRSK